MPFSIDNDFHDAVIKHVSIDYESRSVQLLIDAYENENDKLRKKTVIKFLNVSSFNSLSNLNEIYRNSDAGNINYITFSNKHFYIYLNNGAIELVAEDVEISAVEN